MSNSSAVKPQTLLRQVLQGLPPEVQTNIQTFVMEQNLDENDAVLLAGLISGTHSAQLNEILSTYPQKFDSYSQELKLWSQKISKLSSILKTETKDLSLLANNSKKLTVILTKFLNITTNYTNNLASNNLTLTNLIATQKISITKLEETVNSLNSSLIQQRQEIQQLTQAINLKQNSSKKWITVTNFLLKCWVSLSLLFLLWFAFSDGKAIATKVNWGLIKLRRIECGLELRAPNTPECQSID